MLPRINIYYNKFLDPIFIFYCQNHPDWKKLGWDKWIPPTQEELAKRLRGYQETWNESGSQILASMCEILKLDFQRSVIDVHIVSGNPRQFSRPLVIKSGFSKEDFLITLTHELIHVLLSDNEKNLPDPKKIFPQFPDESQATRNHILVHAVLKHVYLDGLKNPKLLERNIEISEKHSTPEYSRSWQIVEESGYLEIISNFNNDRKEGTTV